MWRARYVLRLPVLLVLAFLVVLPCVRGQIRDGGIDPRNLGKGEWLYYMSSATNHLGGNVAAVTNETSLMLYLKSQGIRYVIVKAATSDVPFYGSYSAPQFTSNLVNTAHACGLLIFGYNRSYGSNIPGEVKITDDIFKAGADGFVWDAEAEWESSQPWISTNGPALAWQLCSTVRSNWPTKFLAHAPFPIISYHSSFPYKEFGYWCDAVMPQIYHFSSSGIKGSMSAAIEWSDANWAAWQKSLYSLPPTVFTNVTAVTNEVASTNVVVYSTNVMTAYWTNAIKPLAPINDVYGPLYSSPTRDKDVMEFIDYLSADPNCVTPGGYKGVSLFRADLHGAAQWAYIKAGSSGTFPGVTNNIVMDDSAASAVGGWTPVRTFYNGFFYGGQTDTNSFGTNYLVTGQGTGNAWVQFTPNIVVPGDYNVYQWHPCLLNASACVPFIVQYNGGTVTTCVNQQTNSGNWSLVGRFNFVPGMPASIRISDAVAEPDKVAIADGLKLVMVWPPNQFVGWGDNTLSQITAPGPITNAIALAAGTWHTLVLCADGTVLAWGENWNHQCDVPPSLTDALAVAAGGYHSLAIRSDGTVLAWGANDYGQASVPPGLTDVIAIAAGTWHSLALSANGSVAAWGDDSWGQIEVPPGLSNVVAIAAGGNHSLALRADGTVVAWGEQTDAVGYFTGQSIVPLGLSQVVSVAAGEYHSLALRADGTVVAWGDNSLNQCNVPLGLNNVVAIAAGAGYSLALKADGTVVGWGDNWSGQADTPAGYLDVIGLAAGGYHTVALLAGNLPPPRLVRPQYDGRSFSVLLQTLCRKTYVLECKNSLGPATWTALRTVNGNGALQLLTDPNPSQPQRFYRIRQY